VTAELTVSVAWSRAQTRTIDRVSSVAVRRVEESRGESRRVEERRGFLSRRCQRERERERLDDGSTMARRWLDDGSTMARRWADRRDRCHRLTIDHLLSLRVCNICPYSGIFWNHRLQGAILDSSVPASLPPRARLLLAATTDDRRPTTDDQATTPCCDRAVCGT